MRVFPRFLRRVVTKRVSDEFHTRSTSVLRDVTFTREDTEIIDQLSPFVGE